MDSRRFFLKNTIFYRNKSLLANNSKLNLLLHLMMDSQIINESLSVY